MKLKFKVEPYPTNGVEAVVDCFVGQPMSAGIVYRRDLGRAAQLSVTLVQRIKLRLAPGAAVQQAVEINAELRAARIELEHLTGMAADKIEAGK
jgi:hypothetical protein